MVNEVEPIKSIKLLAKMKKVLSENKRDLALFSLGIHTGLRVSDLLSLVIGDVSDTLGGVRSRVRIKEMKTGKAASIPIGDTAKADLLAYLSERGEAGQEEPLFVSRKGKDGEMRPISRGRAYRIIKDAATAAGVKTPVGTHSMRKTFGFHAYKAGNDLVLIQKLLRHSSPDVTLRYIGITQEQLDEVVLNLEL